MSADASVILTTGQVLHGRIDPATGRPEVWSTPNNAPTFAVKRATPSLLQQLADVTGRVIKHDGRAYLPARERHTPSQKRAPVNRGPLSAIEAARMEFR